MVRIANAINTALIDLLYEPSAAEKLKEDFYAKGYNGRNSSAKLMDNILTLSFHGAKSTSIVTQSILAASFEQSECKRLYRNSIESNPEQMAILPMKKLIGRNFFASLREVFLENKDGKPIPTYNYTF